MKGDVTVAANYEALKCRLTGSAVFYCAVSARIFGTITRGFGSAGLLAQTDAMVRRIFVEKPFVSGLASARALDRELLSLAEKNRIYRIDHFLGKETVQTILALRYANRYFAPIYPSEHIDHVEITAAETLGVVSRGAFWGLTHIWNGPVGKVCVASIAIGQCSQSPAC